MATMRLAPFGGNTLARGLLDEPGRGRVPGEGTRCMGGRGIRVPFDGQRRAGGMGEPPG